MHIVIGNIQYAVGDNFTQPISVKTVVPLQQGFLKYNMRRFVYKGKLS